MCRRVEGVEGVEGVREIVAGTVADPDPADEAPTGCRAECRGVRAEVSSTPGAWVTVCKSATSEQWDLPRDVRHMTTFISGKCGFA